MNRTRLILAMVAALLGAACSNEPTSSAPRPGTLVLRLATPHVDDGAVLFKVSGPPIDTALAVDASLRLFTGRPDRSTLLGAVVGVVDNGAVVTLQVPDVGLVAGYTAQVLEVADRQNALRPSLAGYALTVAR